MQAGGSLVEAGKYSPFSVSTSLLWRISLEFDGFELETNRWSNPWSPKSQVPRSILGTHISLCVILQDRLILTGN